MNEPEYSADRDGDWDEQAGTFAGRTFPSESEWLEPTAQSGAGQSALTGEDLIGEDLIGEDFVERTLAALGAPSPAQLATFAAPDPSGDFVHRAVAALQSDRRDRWRDLMARHVAPVPSGQFVARTLAALANDPGVAPPRDRQPSQLRRLASTWALPLLAAAAVLAVAIGLPRDSAVVFELRAANAVPAAFAPAYAATPLPALLTVLDSRRDPDGLPNTGADGIWLLLQGSPK